MYRSCVGVWMCAQRPGLRPCTSGDDIYIYIYMYIYIYIERERDAMYSENKHDYSL